MCKLGDIIVVSEFKGEDGANVPTHSFIVVDDTHDKIKGLNYDFVAPIMSSFRDEEHRKKILSYSVNKEITNSDLDGDFKLKKASYVKANKLYYFDKKNIKYYVLARVNDDFLEELMKVILTLDEKDRLSIITTNLKEEQDSELETVWHLKKNMLGYSPKLIVK